MIEEQAVSIFVDSPLQIYEDLAGDTVELKDLKDRKALFEAIDEFISQQKREGISWRILGCFLDFLLSEKDKTLHDMSAELSRVIEGNYEAKNFYDKGNYRVKR